MLRRMSSSPPSWSPPWLRTAPQQPAPSGTIVCTPARSSTRAVAALMLGFIAGCTQPIEHQHLARVRALRPQALARARRRLAGLARTLALSDCGSSGRMAWPSFSAGANSGDVRPSRSSQRLARSPSGRSTLASTMRRPMSTSLPYSTPDGQVRLAVAAGQAAIQVQLRGARGLLALEHLLHQVDAAARAVELVAQQLVGGAGGRAEAAVHALAQDGLGLDAIGRAGEFGRERGLHRVRVLETHRAAGHEDAVGIERFSQAACGWPASAGASGVA